MIRGYVIDATSREPLPAATVLIEESDKGASTNLDGYFVIDFIEAGEYSLLVSHLGYREKYQTVVAQEYSREVVYLELIPGAVQLEEAVVSIESQTVKTERIAPTVSTVPISAKLVRRMPSLGGEMDVLRALQTIPGVKASSDISSALYVRGGSTDQTLILMDHNVVYNPSHLFGLFSTFNADAVKHLELMKGGFSAEYGGRSGSVLEVITNDGNRKKTEGMFSLGIISSRGSLEGPLPRRVGSYAISLRRTYMEPVLELMRKTMDTDLPDYYFYDANGKLNLDLTDRTTLTLAGYWGNDRLDAEFGPEDSRLQMYMSWGNKTFSTRLRHALNSSIYLSISTAVSKYNSEWSIENDDVLFDRARDRLYDRSVKSDLEIYHGNHKFKTGIWFSQYDIVFKEEREDVVLVDVDEVVNNYAGYIQDHWKVNSFLEVKPGIRFYYHDEGEHKVVDPRLAMVYHWDPRLRFKLAGGRYSQFINLMTFGESFTNFDLWIPIDESMTPSRSDQVITGLEYDFPDELELTVEAYYTDMKNIAIVDPMVKEAEVASDAFLEGKGYAWGFEWMLRRKEGRLNGWLGYSLSWVRHKFPDSAVNAGNWYYPKWDRRHDFIAVANYRLSPAWDLSWTWRYNTGQGYTQAKGLYSRLQEGISAEDYGNHGVAVLTGTKNNYRFPDDHRLDFTASWNHKLFNLDAKLNISVYNVYNRRSHWFKYFDTYENPVEITDVKLLPVLPLLSYELRF